MTEITSHGKLVKFIKYDGTPSWIRISEETYMPTGGAFGAIYRADTEVLGRPRNFVIKKFRGDMVKAKRDAERAFNNYRRAKKAGLKVFPTYRMGEDERSILMTDGNANSTIVLSNNINLQEIGLPLIKDEAITPALTDAIIEHAKLASQQNILIPNDAYFFLFNRGNKTIDFTLGDLDKLGQDISPAHALWHNLRTARNAVISFMASNAESPYLQIRNADARFKAEGEMGN